MPFRAGNAVADNTAICVVACCRSIAECNSTYYCRLRLARYKYKCHNVLRACAIWAFGVARAVLSHTVIKATLPCELGRSAESFHDTRKMETRRCHEAMDRALPKGADKDEAKWAGRLRVGRVEFASVRNAATRSRTWPDCPATGNLVPNAKLL